MKNLELVTKGNILPQNEPDELAQVNQRLVELQSERQSQQVAFETAQNAYLTGRSTLDEFSGAQSKLNLIDDALALLTNKQFELEAAEEAAKRQVERNELMKHAAARAEYSAAGAEEYLRLHAALNDFIASQTAKMLEALYRWRGGQNAFVMAVAQIDPTVRRNIFAPNGWTGNYWDLIPELIAAGSSNEALRRASAENVFSPEIVAFDGAIRLAESLQWIKNEVVDPSGKELAALPERAETKQLAA